MAALKIKDISFRYGVEDVLKTISLNIGSGQLVSILGPNGSGKTTLLKNMCNILEPHEGSIDILEQSMDRYSYKELAKKVAVVHQSAEHDFEFTVEEVVLMGRYPYLKRFQNESAKDLKIAEESMRKTSTYHLKNKSIKAISGGERQRVMIARALTQETDILMLDEPISHLDIKYQMEILKLCKRLNEEKQLTIVTTLHDINLASRFSDYIVLMKEGEIVHFGKPEDVITTENILKVYELDVELFMRYSYPWIVPE
jgi:iron complex transport system ATP-binding protein